MKYHKTMLRRAQVQARLEANEGQAFSVRLLGREYGVDQRIAKYDLEWLALNRGLKLSYPERDTVVYLGVRPSAHDSESHPGRQFAIIGQCDFCDSPFLQDGHTRFCSTGCRSMFNLMSYGERQTHIANKLGSLSPETMAAEPSREGVRERIEKAMAEVPEAAAAPKLKDVDPTLEGDHNPDEFKDFDTEELQ